LGSRGLESSTGIVLNRKAFWMINDSPNPRRKNVRPRIRKEPATMQGGCVLIEAERAGDWMPVEELREAALVATQSGRDVTVNLDRIDHLDASALQILLALGAEQRKLEHKLELANVSANLRRWFEYAGAADQFFQG
jgi:anti-anti-sigma regulatory factor